MFCYQCEQTAKGTGCVKIGVCGKQPDVAALQDLLIYALKGLSQVALAAREKGINERKVNVFICEAIFSTLTNVNFDPQRVADLVNECVKLRDELKQKLVDASGQVPDSGPAVFEPATNLEDMVTQGEEHGILACLLYTSPSPRD